MPFAENVACSGCTMHLQAGQLLQRDQILPWYELELQQTLSFVLWEGMHIHLSNSHEALKDATLLCMVQPTFVCQDLLQESCN